MLMLVALTLIASLLAAFIASAHAAATSIARGDSLRCEWSRRTVFGTTAMVAVWAAYFLIGGVIVPALRW
jgi:hypothetical protein